MRKQKLREVMRPTGMSHSTTVTPMMNCSQSFLVPSLGAVNRATPRLCLPLSAGVFSEEALTELLGEVGPPPMLGRRRYACLKETPSDVFNYM